MTNADLFWVIVVALILAIAYILWNTREKGERGNMIRDKKGSSALVVLIEVCAAFILLYIVSSALGVCPKTAQNGVAWLNSNFTLLVFLACFSLGAYVFLKVSGNKKGHGNDKGFYHCQTPINDVSLAPIERRAF